MPVGASGRVRLRPAEVVRNPLERGWFRLLPLAFCLYLGLQPGQREEQVVIADAVLGNMGAEQPADGGGQTDLPVGAALGRLLHDEATDGRAIGGDAAVDADVGDGPLDVQMVGVWCVLIRVDVASPEFGFLPQRQPLWTPR